MKKTVLFLVVTFVFTNISYSQEEDLPFKSTTIYGFKAGLNQSYLNASSDNGYSGLELYGGFFAEASLSQLLRGKPTKHSVENIKTFRRKRRSILNLDYRVKKLVSSMN